MSHPLEQQIARLRRKVRLLVWLHGLSWLVAATLAALLMLGLLDYVCHFNPWLRETFPWLREFFDDQGIRVICSLAVAGVFVWIGYRYVVRGARARFADVALASRVEGRFPDLHDRLTSAVEFLRESEQDPQAGSAELRRAVIAQTTAAVEQLQLSQTVDYRPALRAGVVAAAALVIASVPLFGEHSRSLAFTALARLGNPLGGPNWPQVTHLRFKEEIERMGTGQPLELVVEDAHGATLPKGVKLWVRFDGETNAQSFKMQGDDGRTVAHRFAAVTRPFTYWAEGGDDSSMRQRPLHLDVSEPPAVQARTIELHPPAYTGWPSTKVDRQIRALEGTRIAVEGTSNKPLRSAALCLIAPKKDATGKVRLEIVQESPAEINADGYGFRVKADGPKAFVVSRSGQYLLRLEDTEGIVNPQAPYENPEASYELRSIADQPPTVSIDEPRQDGQYTAGAVVPLRITAKDDLALRGVTLRIIKAGPGKNAKTTTQEVTILPAETSPPPQPLGLATDKLGDARSLTHELALAEVFSNLAPDTQLTLVVTASDFRPLSGQSSELRLHIIEPAKLLGRVSDLQRAILQKLHEVLVTQRTARKELGGVQARFEQLGRLEKIDLDGLERSKLSQDRVNDGLGNETNGVIVQVERLLAYLADNRVDSTDIVRRLQELLAELRRLQKNQLPAIASELRDAGKAAQSKLDSPAAQQKVVGDNLGAAGKHQDEVIAALEAILGSMKEWDNRYSFSRDIAALRREQQGIANEAAKIAPDTLTKDFKDLTPTQQGDLKKLGRRQQDLAREFDAIQQRMENMQAQLSDKDPLAAGLLEDALHHARSQRLSGALRNLASNLDENQLGRAAERHQAVDGSLAEMLDILANRREKHLSRLLEKLRNAEKELTDLANRQKGLQKKMQAAAANKDEGQKRRELEKLAEQQRELQKEADRLARKLRRLEAERAAASAESAAGAMSKAGEQSQKGDAEAAQKSTEQALQDLDQAQQELAETRRQAEIDLAMEQLAKISDALLGLKNRQQALSAETLRLDQLSKGQSLSDPQKESVRDLARQEGHLQQDALKLAEKLAEGPVFQAALKGAARELELAADELKQLKTGIPTQTAQRNALRRFEQLLEALKPEPADNAKKKEGGGKQPPVPKDGIPNIAQLKLLRMMQVELNQRTKELDAAMAGRKPEDLTDIDRRQRQLISQQQGEIARLTLNLSQPADPGEGTEPLPEFSPDELDKMLDNKTLDNKKLDNEPAKTKNQSGKKALASPPEEENQPPPATEPRPATAPRPPPKQG